MADGLVDRAATARTFHALDGLRGVAALFVVALHYHTYLAPLAVGSAYLAVDLFFVMSGFVLAHAYERRLAGALTPGRFLAMRVVRLYPLYLVGTAFALGLAVFGHVRHTARALSWPALLLAGGPALLMLPSPPRAGLSELYPLDFPAWSLLFELVANLAYAAVVRRVPARAQWLVIPASAAVLVAGTIGYGSADAGHLWSQWWMGLARVGFSFPVGVALYRLHRAERLPVVPVPAAIVLAAVALLLGLAPPPGWRAGYDLLCILLLFPVAVALCAGREPRLGVRLFAWAGLVSFPLYVIHVPARDAVGSMAKVLLGARTGGLAPWIGLALVALLLGLSWLLAVSFDGRARRWLGRRIGWRAPTVP